MYKDNIHYDFMFKWSKGLRPPRYHWSRVHKGQSIRTPRGNILEPRPKDHVLQGNILDPRPKDHDPWENTLDPRPKDHDPWRKILDHVDKSIGVKWVWIPYKKKRLRLPRWYRWSCVHKGQRIRTFQEISLILCPQGSIGFASFIC